MIYNVFANRVVEKFYRFISDPEINLVQDTDLQPSVFVVGLT